MSRGTSIDRTTLIRMAGLSALGALLAALLCTVPALAHQDMIIPRSDSGELDRLPAKYQPATLKITRDTSSDGSNLQVVLRIGGWRVEMPPCLSKLFDVPPKPGIEITASWYHLGGRSKLPPYINIRLPRPGGFFRPTKGYKLLFNLENGTLIYVTHFSGERDSSIQYKKLRLSALCEPAERDQLMPVPAK